MTNTHASCIQYVPVATLGRTAPGAAAAPTMVHVTPLMAPVSVIQDGSAVTAHSVRSLNEMINDIHGGSYVVVFLLLLFFFNNVTVL